MERLEWLRVEEAGLVGAEMCKESRARKVSQGLDVFNVEGPFVEATLRENQRLEVVVGLVSGLGRVTEGVRERSCRDRERRSRLCRRESRLAAERHHVHQKVHHDTCPGVVAVQLIHAQIRLQQPIG